MDKIRWQQAKVSELLKGKELWTGIGPKFKYVVTNQEASTNFGIGNYITIKKYNLNEDAAEKFSKDSSKDVSYSEKLQIMSGVGKWKRFGLEIFSSNKNVDKDEDSSCILELDGMRIFPFPSQLAFIVPNTTDFKPVPPGKVRGRYVKKTLKTDIGEITYLYLRSDFGHELKRQEKRELKERIMGDCTAIEIVCNYVVPGVVRDTCLICLPDHYKLKIEKS